MTLHPYASPDYASAAAEGSSRFFCESLGIWLVRRPIPGTELFDAQGLYPFASQLRRAHHADLVEELGARGLVSLVFVTDCLEPGLDWTASLDLTWTYKSHHVVDFLAGPVHFSRHHRQEIRRALRHCEVRRVDLRIYLDQWRDLYDTLVRRRNLGARHRFSDWYFEALCNIPGFEAVAAFVGDRMVCGHIWARSGLNVYSHLAASSDEGYRIGAAYAVYDSAIRHFSDASAIDLGGRPDGEDGKGLDYLKSGFSNTNRWNRICGVILNPARYAELSEDSAANAAVTPFFPSYRQGETPQR